MATYKSNAGAILQPGNQINKLSSYNKEGVHGWPGLEFYELIGFAKVSNKSGTKANFKSFDITIPSPDRRPDDRVRDDRTSLVVPASSTNRLLMCTKHPLALLRICRRITNIPSISSNN